MNTEIARLALYKEGECWIAQYAINGRKCTPFYVHESTRRNFNTDESFQSFLEQKAVEMLEMYGQVN